MAVRSSIAKLLTAVIAFPFLGAQGVLAADAGGPAGGAVSIFSDQVAFAIDAPTPAQQARGYFGGGSISGLFPTDEPGHMVVVTPPGRALVGRHLDLPLSRIPFLTWSWRRLPPDMGQPETLTHDAPMRLIVGFVTTPEDTPSPPPPAHSATNDLPPYDRALVVTWSNDPWDSGITDRRGDVGRFVAHGGPPDGQWWEQAVDLADVHNRLWPYAPLSSVKVAWVAVAVRESAGRTLGEIAGVALAP